MIYLDHSATAPLCPAARAAMNAAMDTFGNPSSLHFAGLEAARTVREARERLYSAMDVPPYARIDAALPPGAGNPKGKRLFFTSCGSESDNFVIFGLLSAKNFRKIPRIVTTDSEHPAMLSPLRELAAKGRIDLVLLSTKGGKLDLTELEAALTPETLLVSIMQVNNETGAIYDLPAAFALTRRKVPSAITHTDAVQGFLKINIPLSRLGADLITVSAHKIGGPKGVGGLLVDNGLLIAKRLSPLIYGGGQEGGLRSGTENVIGIAGFGAAAEAAKAALPSFEGRMLALREAFIARLTPEVRINTPERFAPHILSLTLPGIKSETMLRWLSEREICVSNGSACSSHKRTASPVLLAFGLSPAEADCTVRISLGEGNTPEQMERAAEAIAVGCRELARIGAGSPGRAG